MPALCDVGQREARAAVAPGLTELDVWACVRAAIEREAGSRTPLLADLASGPRTGESGGAPGGRVLAEGDQFALVTDNGHELLSAYPLDL